MSVIKWLFRPFLKLAKWILRCGVKLSLTGSVCLGFAAVVAGMYVGNKFGAIFSIPCVAAGCFLSGVLFQSFLGKLIAMSEPKNDDRSQHKIRELEGQLEHAQSKHKDELNKLEQEIEARRANEENMKSQLDELQKAHLCEIENKETTIAGLQAECARLEKQRIDVNSLRSVLELALAEVDMHMKDVEIDWDLLTFNKESSTLGIHSPAECQQYIGIFEYEFKAKFGIDMKRLKVSWNDEKRILTVHGMKAVHIGNQGDNSHWLLREVQTFKLKKLDSEDKLACSGKSMTHDGFWRNCSWYQKDESEVAKGSLDMNELKSYYEQQESTLRKRVSQGGGAEFKPIQDYVVNMGKAFIRCLLAPLLKAYAAEIEFVDEPNATGKSLEEFIEMYNNSPDRHQPLSATSSMQREALRQIGMTS